MLGQGLLISDTLREVDLLSFFPYTSQVKVPVIYKKRDAPDSVFKFHDCFERSVTKVMCLFSINFS